MQPKYLHCPESETQRGTSPRGTSPGGTSPGGAGPRLPCVPRSGQGSILHRWQTCCLQPEASAILLHQAAGHIALSNNTWVCTYCSVLSGILVVFQVSPSSAATSAGRWQEPSKPGKKKGGERWENSPECRTSPTWTMGCPGPCPCPAARSAARAGSPARPPTGGNWQSSVAPNYTSWVPGPLTPRSQSERLFV